MPQDHWYNLLDTGSAVSDYERSGATVYPTIPLIQSTGYRQSCIRLWVGWSYWIFHHFTATISWIQAVLCQDMSYELLYIPPNHWYNLLDFLRQCCIAVSDFKKRGAAVYSTPLLIHSRIQGVLYQVMRGVELVYWELHIWSRHHILHTVTFF